MDERFAQFWKVCLLSQSSSGGDFKVAWEWCKHKYAIMALFEVWLLVLSTNVLQMGLWPFESALF